MRQPTTTPQTMGRQITHTQITESQITETNQQITGQAMMKQTSSKQTAIKQPGIKQPATGQTGQEQCQGRSRRPGQAMAIRLTAAFLSLLLIAALAGCGGGSSGSISGGSGNGNGAGASASPAPGGASGGSTGGAADSSASGSADSSASGSTSTGSRPAASAPPTPSAPSGGTSNAAPPPPNYADGQHYSGDYVVPNSDEEYLVINENRMVSPLENPLLTFSLKVDTASYRNVVRYIESGNLPPTDAVRIEEMINYFRYDLPLEPDDTPFAVYTELGPSPFSADRALAFVRVRSKDVSRELLPPANLTFLIDVSGSMSSYDKLPLLKSAFSLLVETLGPDDTVSIVTYAGESRVALDSARGNDKKRIMGVINSLEAGGSTAGAGGIQAAYRLAEKNYRRDGNNRVILATDGDFNVGVSSVDELDRLISEKRDTGIYLSILGVGTENIKDNKMETLAKNGNGNYNYLDSVATAKKVLVDELAANLFVIADDVKAQVEFNPALVSDYRLIGYENRSLQNRDFADDTKDAGEIGVGTDVILLFELTLHSAVTGELKYSAGPPPADPGEYGDEFFEVRIRYKEPGGSVSRLITVPVKTDRFPAYNTDDFRFASSVAAFGHLLRDSRYTGDVRLADVIGSAEDSLGTDDGGLRSEFVRILKQYSAIRR